MVSETSKTVYGVFFRGINVGGKNIVKMAELSKLLTKLGFTGVKTYIQSGNVVFFAEGTKENIKRKIEQGFEETFGFACAVMLRTGDEIKAMIENLPFPREELAEAEEIREVEHLYVFLLDEPPQEEEVRRICEGYEGRDKLAAINRELYLLVYQSIRDAKLAGALARLKVPMTARNWKTLNKIAEMIKDMERT